MKGTGRHEYKEGERDNHVIVVQSFFLLRKYQLIDLYEMFKKSDIFSEQVE